ncbi:alcohol dehydrogenase [Rhynchospora pubera]|uniref:Alcohol dehydrogenase n=1 Tax=Rhynchospora pubera TaxID=906938 RepID=A0AAV8GQ32_9POAL|nr:alcohol dehydrogenase [Rhynchospora pubera]
MASNGSTTVGHPITCKAAIVWGPSEPLVVQEVRVDLPKRLEVRMKVLYTSICHTDLSAWKGENESQRAYPRILGHEAAGVVESVGEGVEDLKPGDHVVPIFTGECGNCSYCKSDMTNLCGDFRVNPLKSTMVGDGKTRFSAVGPTGGDPVPVYHFLNTSTFSEYTVLDSACVVKINPNAPLERMCLLSCGISTGVGAAWNTANVTEGSTVAIFGLGAVGLAVAEGSRLRGASKIIGVDINPDKFAKGEEMGITDFINSKECNKPVNQVIKEMTNGGVDYSFECAGNLDVLREAFISTHDGWGRTIVLGIHPTPRMLPLHPMELFDGRRITGCVFGDFKGKSQLPDIVDKCMKGEIKINFDGFITHELPFEEINQAFQLLEEGKSLRCLLHL